MNSLYLEELVALNALGALDGEDLAEFKRLVPYMGEEDQREIEEYARVAALIGHAVPVLRTPRQHTREHLLKTVRESIASDLSHEGPAQIPTSIKKDFSFICRDDLEWVDHSVRGVKIKQLSVDRAKGYAVLLMKVAAGTDYPEHRHTGPEECYVLEGDVHVGGRVLGPGDFHHADEGTHHGVLHSEHGATLLLVVAAEDYLPE